MPLQAQRLTRPPRPSPQRYETVLRKSDPGGGGFGRRTSAETAWLDSKAAADGVQREHSVDKAAGSYEPESTTCSDGSVPLHPNSFYRMGWDAFMFVVTVFALMVDPVSLAFRPVSSYVTFLDVADVVVIVRAPALPCRPRRTP